MAVVGAAPASAVPARPVANRFTQPDGSTFSARLYGDEWSNGYETRSGYTVVKNRKSGFWEYAVRRDGGLTASGLRVGKAEPAGIPRHLRERLRGPAAAAANANGSFASDTRNIGSQPSIVLLVDYADKEGSTSEADWNAKFFGPTDSVNHYYDEVSYNQLDFPPAAETSGTNNNGVVGWLRLAGNHPNTGAGIEHDPERRITRNAILQSDSFVDYSGYDTNSNGFISRKELHITVIVAGYEAAYGAPCGPSVWGHNSSLGGTVAAPVVDDVEVASTGGGGGYSQFGEIHCSEEEPLGSEHMATIGIMVHEMGHDLNLPDLYDTSGGSGGRGSDGIGDWSVMASGSWTFTGSDHAGSTPVHPDAFSKWYEGWLTPTLITGSQAGVQLTEMSSTGDVYQLRNNPNGVDWTFLKTPGTGQYFLVENRQKSGYDAGLPGCGVLIWHIDETRTSSNFANADEARKLVDLEEADGLNELDDDTDFEAGDAGDPYRGAKSFSPTSKPNSNLYGGTFSGVRVNNFSSCAPTMTADMTTQLTKTTLSISKTSSKVTGTGRVLPGHPGSQVTVTLYKRRANGTWRKIATKTDTLSSSSRYAKSFGRPSSGRCKMTAKFAKDADHLGSKATKRFRC